MLIGLRKGDKVKNPLRRRYVSLPCERLEARLMLAAEASPLVINLNLGANLTANAPARAAIERAADFWEGVLFDPVVINIAAVMTGVGFPNDKTLALTTSTKVRFLYGDVRNRLIADASADEAIVAQLPTPDLLRFDLAWAVAMVNKTITAPMTQQQFDAWVIHGFNLGHRNFTKIASSVRAFNDGRANEVPARMQLWTKAKLADGTSVKSPGLMRRRAMTAALFANGYESAWKQWRS